MNITTQMNYAWKEHEKHIAKNQLHSYGKIFLDENNLPIHDENKIEELLEMEINE